MKNSSYFLFYSLLLICSQLEYAQIRNKSSTLFFTFNMLKLKINYLFYHGIVK